MKFLEMLRVRITHAYYADGRCPDFHMVPTPDTERLLRNHRCVLKSFPDGITVLIPVVVNKDKDEPLIAFPAETRLTFQLRLHNQEFPLFTDLRRKALTDPAVTITYPVKPELERGVFADVDIHVKELSSPPECLIRFEAKKVKWRYYVVTDKKDVKMTSTEQALQFSQDSDSSDDIASLLARQYASSKSPGMRYLRFTSQNPIACRQQGRDSIALVVDGHKELMPNPSLQKYAKAGDEECLFHVITYFAEPLSK